MNVAETAKRFAREDPVGVTRKPNYDPYFYVNATTDPVFKTG